MAKYDALSELLRTAGEDRTFTFDEIASVVGGLPPSAYAHREWWANTASNSQARAWLTAGRRVAMVNVHSETVRFRPTAGRAPGARERVEPPAAEEAVADGRAEDLPSAVDVSVAGSWRRVGNVTLSQDGLVMPTVDPQPAVYRFVFTTAAGAASVYVGESVDVRRRMRNYRRPSGNQQTSRRINGLLRERLTAGDEVSLDVLQHVRLGSPQPTKEADLSTKAVRVLVEHAALLALSNDGFSVHNL